MKIDGFTLLLLFAGIHAACADAGSDAGDGSSGLRPGGIALDVPGWAVEPGPTIGGADAPAEEVLYTVPAVVEDTAGNFYALSFGDKRVVVFDHAGGFIRSIGREGAGPGELMSPVSIATDRTTSLYILDAAASRITRFRISDGAYQSTITLGVQLGFPVAMQLGGDGMLYVEFRPIQGMGDAAKRTIARVDPESGELHPVLELDLVPQIPVTTTVGGKRITEFVDAPFAPNAVWAVRRDGDLIYGDGSSYTIYHHGGDGSVGVLFRVDADAPAVTAEDRERYRQQHPALDSARIEIDFPSQKPHFTAIRVGPAGSIWLQTAGRQWDVREASGRRLGTIVLPERARIVGLSHGALYLIHTDMDGVETLRRFRLLTSS
ncbi:MAG TPA: 6-bladed beta-propeller [Longimicrobiales bacterium]